jgi:succinate dehydrogenase/fumarate reductase cytochrome b subunit
MSKINKSKLSISKIKEESSSILRNFNNFIQNTIALFKKDESSMNKEEKVEKQHIMTFIYGMIAGVIVYHFLIGVVLIAVVMALYLYSVQKTKALMNEDEVTKK